jgi:hypothetical protein
LVIFFSFAPVSHLPSMPEQACERSLRAKKKAKSMGAGGERNNDRRKSQGKDTPMLFS